MNKRSQKLKGDMSALRSVWKFVMFRLLDQGAWKNLDVRNLFVKNPVNMAASASGPVHVSVYEDGLGEDCSQDTNECSISNGDCQSLLSCEVYFRCTAEWKEMEAKIKRLEDARKNYRK
ncbi:hypothetical protein ACROYT_G002216 [Oculina patagonica]